MLISYSEISNYWNKIQCAGGNSNFPFKAFEGRRVLEVGCGTGLDAFRFMEARALYIGIDLITERNNRPFKFRQMNAEELNFSNNYFDLVYSFGVIHHTLNPEKVISEIYRVLKPDGYIFLMLYNKLSFRYLIEILFLRKILWWLHYSKYDFLRKQNPYPTKEQWVSWNTDTLGCPLARVYNLRDVKKLLKDFIITKTWTENWGWFRMICAKKKCLIGNG